ncbi:MAG TPA: HAMP domain-containing sensor histidine kinase [Bacillales bacterium]|nr:HAMP domain-containing sensor histidine kinase [Bacillales bacterium]
MIWKRCTVRVTGLLPMTSLNLTLTQRIWLSFMLLVLFVGVIIAVVYPISIQGALKQQTYKIIEQQQMQFPLNSNRTQMQPNTNQNGFLESRNAALSVSHIIVTNQLSLRWGASVPDQVLQKMGQNAENQKNTLGEYQLSYQNGTLFYVIRKVTLNGQPAYLISYMWGNYRNSLVKTLWTRLLWVLLIVGVLSSIPAFLLARYLRRPLIMLGNRFEQIAKRNWQTSFQWEQDDEFRHLSDQFEHMRQNLLRYDRSQKTFIQHASHELKTPIMIINSYAQSVKDGILPKADIGETMDVIISESDRMEQRVKELLYYTKLDTLKDETPERNETVFGRIAEDIVERLQVQREDLDFRVKGHDTVFNVDREQWQVLIENLIENALRYAESEICIEARENGDTSTLKVYNDGDPIPEDECAHLFDPFYKGTKGKFGLGLAIVKRVVELHSGEITVENESNGVSFIVNVPKKI